MTKSHKKSKKEYKYETDSDSDSLGSCATSDYGSDKEDSPVCEITNQDIAQAFALFDFRLTRLCEKLGVNMDDTPTPPKNSSTSTGTSTSPVESKTPAPVFPQIPIYMDPITEDKKLPPALRPILYGENLFNVKKP